MLQEIFGFAEHQEKASNGLGYKLTLTRNTDNAVLNKGNAINSAKIKLIVLIVMYHTMHLALKMKVFF